MTCEFHIVKDMELKIWEQHLQVQSNLQVYPKMS